LLDLQCSETASSTPARSWSTGPTEHTAGKSAQKSGTAYPDGDGHVEIGSQSAAAAMRVLGQRTAAGRTAPVFPPAPAPAPVSVDAAGPPAAADLTAAAVAVVVMADDLLSGQGAVAYLRARAEVEILGADRLPEAEVVLLLLDTIGQDTAQLIERTATTCPRAGFVLVGDAVREQHLVRAIRYAPLSVILRREADFDHIVQAIVDIREERLEMPAYALGLLERRLRTITHEVLEPNGLTAAGFERRELDILRLLAEGLATPEIAERLNYSERTVKSIIRKLLTRFNFRNRTHAVAHAVRSGIL
jgi:DNA-binding NarL/FixJ family response regulator